MFNWFGHSSSGRRHKLRTKPAHVHTVRWGMGLFRFFLTSCCRFIAFGSSGTHSFYCVAFVVVQFNKIIKLNFHANRLNETVDVSNATIRPIVANANHNGAKSVMNRNRRSTISVRSSHSASTATDKQMADKWTRTRRQWYAYDDDDDDNRSIDTDTVHLPLLSHIPDSIWRSELWGKNKQMRNVCCSTATHDNCTR